MASSILTEKRFSQKHIHFYNIVISSLTSKRFQDSDYRLVEFQGLFKPFPKEPNFISKKEKSYRNQKPDGVVNLNAYINNYIFNYYMYRL